MDYENDDKDDTKRRSRNLSEKKRRDQFNMLVNELSSMVSANNRKMDKSTVLKSTIAFLKNHNEVSSRSKVHEIQSNWKPPFLSNEEFTHLILEALDGFIIVFSSSGRIYYASEGISSLLGHIPVDLLNLSIYELVYKDDQSILYNIFHNSNALIDPSQQQQQQQHGNIKTENQVTFTCHIKRENLGNSAQESYESVQFVGYFRSESDIDSISGARYAAQTTASGYGGENRMVFVGTGRLQTPQLIREMPIANTKSEFTSRHSLEWKFLFLDHRAPPIIGYLPFEVLGTSGYDYYHFDDLEKVVTCHEALMQKGEGTSCFYRFLTKGQQWIWLQTRFYITYHQWNSKPEFVVCTHRVVSYADAVKQNRSTSLDEKENDQKIPSPTISPWSRSSRAPKIAVSDIMSPKSRGYRRYTGPGSDSTSMSADSPSSCHYSVMSHPSARSKSRSSSHHQPLRPANQSSTVNCMQMSSHPQTPYYTPMAQMIPNHSRHQNAPTQMLAPAFIESPQYVAAIPVQPAMIAATPAAFANQAAVIQQLQPPQIDFLPSNVILTPAQNQMGDQLQRRHEELQHLIQQQQEELRRVSEQLMMARYGLVQGLPAAAFSSPSNSPCDPTSFQLHQHQHHHQQHNNEMMSSTSQQTQSQMHEGTSTRMHQMSHQISDPGGGREPSEYSLQMDQMSNRSESDVMPYQIQPQYGNAGEGEKPTSNQ